MDLQTIGVFNVRQEHVFDGLVSTVTLGVSVARRDAEPNLQLVHIQWCIVDAHERNGITSVASTIQRFL